jgi:hypothetical protein
MKFAQFTAKSVSRNGLNSYLKMPLNKVIEVHDIGHTPIPSMIKNPASLVSLLAKTQQDVLENDSRKRNLRNNSPHNRYVKPM